MWKERKRCLSERLKSTTLHTSAVPTKYENYRAAPFKTVRTSILTGPNRMLAHIERSSYMKGLHTDFSNGGKGDVGNGLYNQKGELMGMLEARNYRSIDMVFPLIGMLVDRYSSGDESASVTRLYTIYVDIMQEALSYNNYSHIWSEQWLVLLERNVKLFEIMSRNICSQFQACEFCTEKFHQLEHIIYDLKSLVGLRYGDAGLYEHARTFIKSAYRTGSKPNQFAMQETMTAYVKDMNIQSS